MYSSLKVKTKYVEPGQVWMLESLFGKEYLEAFFKDKSTIDDTSVEDLFEGWSGEGFLYRKNKHSYLSLFCNTELLRYYFCSKPQKMQGKELLQFGIPALEESKERSYAQVPNKDGEIIFFTPFNRSDFDFQTRLEEIGLYFTLIFKPNDSVPRIFSSVYGDYKGQNQIQTFINSFKS